MKKKNVTNLKRILILCVAAIFVCGILLYQKIHVVTYTAADCSESAGTLSNPYCGWYSIHGYIISDDKALLLPKEASVKEKNSAGLVLLEVNLKNYASRAISQTGLQQINDLLAAWKDNGSQIILRFLYDWDGKGESSEPSDIELIEQHMEQVAGIVNTYKASIWLMQGIFVGDCGEMHGTKHMGNGDTARLMEKLASVIDPSIYLSVRTPSQLRSILNTADPLTDSTAFDGSLASRLGLYNDGMLGSDTDLGTYGSAHAPELGLNIHWTRNEEIAFQNQLCQYVPNGGEVVLDNSFNDAEHAISDLRAMHVSYLDRDYDAAVLNKWKNTAYTGTDPLYQGATAYDYLSDHLGYRYVLKDSSIKHASRFAQNATLSLSVENVGFSGSYHRFQTKVTLVSENGNQLTLPVDTDTRYWNAGETEQLLLTLNLSDLSNGTYHVYLKLQDTSLNREIHLATTAEHNEYGYCTGMLSVEKYIPHAL